MYLPCLKFSPQDSTVLFHKVADYVERSLFLIIFAMHPGQKESKVTPDFSLGIMLRIDIDNTTMHATAMTCTTKIPLQITEAQRFNTAIHKKC